MSDEYGPNKPCQRTGPTQPLTVAADEHLVIDLTPCCPWCFEDAGSRWCRCDPIAENHPHRQRHRPGATAVITLLTVLCAVLFIGATGFFIAWGRAERLAFEAEQRATRAEARLEERRCASTADRALAQHWATVPREQPTQPLPKTDTTDPAATRRLHVVIPYRVASRKDHLL